MRVFSGATSRPSFSSRFAKPTGFSAYAEPILFAAFPLLHHGPKARYGWVANSSEDTSWHLLPTGTCTCQIRRAYPGAITGQAHRRQWSVAALPPVQRLVRPTSANGGSRELIQALRPPGFVPDRDPTGFVSSTKSRQIRQKTLQVEVLCLA